MGALLVLVCVPVSAQTVFFSETFGNPSSTTPVGTYTGYDNTTPVTYTGTADVRTSTPSIGYTGASGQGNVFITNAIGTNLTISGINSSAYSGITMSLGHFKSTTLSSTELVIEVSSDGVTYTPLTYSRPPGAGTAVWQLITPSGTIPATTNLRIRFRQTSATPQFRIDDIKLTGTAACAVPTTQASNITGIPGFQNINLTWTNGNGSGRIVKINTVNTFTPPVNGVSPTANAAYAGSGEQVVYNGSGNSVNVTGLEPCTEYWFRVYESNCSGTSILFNTSTATNNPATFTTTSNMTGTQTLIAEDFEGVTPAWAYSVSAITVGSGGTLGSNVTEIRPLFGYLESKGLVKSYSVNNGAGSTGSQATIEFSQFTVPAGSNNVRLLVKVASLNELGDIAGNVIPPAPGPQGRGNDMGEDLKLSISRNGGGYVPTFTQPGYSNKLFDYTPQVNATLMYDANQVFGNTGHENNFTINFPAGTTEVQLKFVISNNRVEEAWCIDDIILMADVPAVSTLPLIYALTGGGSYCSGGTGVLVGLDNSQTGISYQLYLNGTAVGSPVVGTGSAISFGMQTGAGTYTVTATNNTYSNCRSEMSNPVTITIVNGPTTSAIWHN